MMYGIEERGGGERREEEHRIAHLEGNRIEQNRTVCEHCSLRVHRTVCALGIGLRIKIWYTHQYHQ